MHTFIVINYTVLYFRSQPVIGKKFFVPCTCFLPVCFAAVNLLPPRKLCLLFTPKGFARYAFCVTKRHPVSGTAPETP